MKTLSKLLSMAVTVMVISVITFAVFQLLPGDPAQLILGTEAQPEALAALRERLGLNQPLAVRFMAWLKGMFVGDFGISISYDVPVLKLIVNNLAVTLGLALYSMVLAVLLGLPLGIYAAVRHGSAADYIVLFLSQLGLAIPSFWMGIVLILLFATTLRIFGVSGYIPWHQSLWGALKSLTLPAVALALPRAAVVLRMARSSMLSVLREDYVRTAYSKGLSHGVVVYKHALKNALIPVVTVVGLQLAGLLAGAIVVEQVFALPGIGNLLLVALGKRDLPLMQGLVMFIASGVVVINTLTDLLYSMLDPRLKRGGL